MGDQKENEIIVNPPEEVICLGIGCVKEDEDKISLPDKPPVNLPAIERARSQDDCPSDGFVFNQQACACFSLRATLQFCLPPTRQDPISGGPCVGQDRIDEIYNHGLGENCGAELGEPEKSDPPIEVERVSGPEECPAGTIFVRKACACFPEVLCARFCPRPEMNNPLGCNCIS